MFGVLPEAYQLELPDIDRNSYDHWLMNPDLFLPLLPPKEFLDALLDPGASQTHAAAHRGETTSKPGTSRAHAAAQHRRITP